MVRDYRPEEGIIEMLCINYDITTLKETEQNEIRTPLNAIVGFSAFWQKRTAEANGRNISKSYKRIMNFFFATDIGHSRSFEN